MKKFLIVFAILACLIVPTAFIMGQIAAKAELKQAATEVMNDTVPYEFYLDVEENPDLEYYSAAIGYENIFTYGDGITSDNMEYIIMDLLNWLPNTMSHFITENGIIIVCNGDFIETVGKLTGGEVPESTDGVYFKSRIDNKTPMICINYSKYTRDDLGSFFTRDYTLIHELAHYMDDVTGASATKEFAEYFKKYAGPYKTTSPVVENYEETNVREFFAVLTTDILKTGDLSELNIPEDLMAYMQKILLRMENIDVTK